MMAKYSGRCSLKQFIKSKPIRFGIKFRAICNTEGYLFDFDIYCGKNSNSDNLQGCALGSCIVMKMFQVTPSEDKR